MNKRPIRHPRRRSARRSPPTSGGSRADFNTARNDVNPQQGRVIASRSERVRHWRGNPETATRTKLGPGDRPAEPGHRTWPPTTIAEPDSTAARALPDRSYRPARVRCGTPVSRSARQAGAQRSPDRPTKRTAGRPCDGGDPHEHLSEAGQMVVNST